MYFKTVPLSELSGFLEVVMSLIYSPALSHVPSKVIVTQTCVSNIFTV